MVCLCSGFWLWFVGKMIAYTNILFIVLWYNEQNIVHKMSVKEIFDVAITIGVRVRLR